MATDTTNYLLKKPTVGGDDDLWGGYINDNMDTIDTQMKSNDDAAAAAQSTADTANTTANAALPKAGGTMTGDIAHGDNVKAKFGASDDLQIYHDGSNSYVQDLGSGSLYLKTNGSNVNITSDAGNMALFARNGAVNLYHNNSNKFATTSTGVDVTGTVTADGADIDGAIAVKGNDFLDSDGTNHYIKTTASGANYLYGGSSIALTANSSGNVGIGTTSPGANLDVTDVSGEASIDIDGFTGNNSRLTYRENGTARFSITHVASDNALQFYNSYTGSESARIDSSGNLLVGKTVADNTTVGARIDGANGYMSLSRDGYESLILNRKTSDGNIAIFRKDGTTVGSIGVKNGDNLYLSGGATDHTGIECSALGILSMKNGVAGSNNVDLGSNSYLWKDLYLGGGVYLGGTGAANKLDDYEEGTWTPVWKVGTTSQSITGLLARYKKIGDLVTVTFRGYVSSPSGTGNVTIEGLPFAPASFSSLNYQNFPWVGYKISRSNGVPYMQLEPASTTLKAVISLDNGLSSNVTDTELGDTPQIRFTIQYHTS